jgi:hypothetical protein
MANNKKRVIITPYRCKLNGTTCTTENLKEIFKHTNLNDNIIAFVEDNPLLLIIDKAENDFIFGRFMLLTKDALDKLNTKERKFIPIDIAIDEFVVHTSHFIWNVKDNIIFGEFNFHGIRHFINPFKNYLDKKFSCNTTIMEMIEDLDTLSRFKKDKNGYTKFTVRTAQKNLSKIESDQKSFLNSMFKISPEENANITITIGRDRRNAFFNSDEVIKFAENLKKKEPLRRLEVETANAVYDLLNNNMFRYKLSVEKTSKNRINKDDFYNQLKGLYADKIGEIKSMISNN